MPKTSAQAAAYTMRRYTSSPEWYTPPWLMARVAVFLGDMYDPCPASLGVISENGLAVSWKGKRVYCNPPYGADIHAWIRKAATEPTRELIMLVPGYTDTNWFQPLFLGTSICFLKGRLQFDRPLKKTPGRSPHPSVLVYRGRRHKAFAEAFSDIGTVMRTVKPQQPKQPRLLSA